MNSAGPLAVRKADFVNVLQWKGVEAAKIVGAKTRVASARNFMLASGEIGQDSYCFYVLRIRRLKKKKNRREFKLGSFYDHEDRKNLSLHIHDK